MVDDYSFLKKINKKKKTQTRCNIQWIFNSLSTSVTDLLWKLFCLSTHSYLYFSFQMLLQELCNTQNLLVVPWTPLLSWVLQQVG